MLVRSGRYVDMEDKNCASAHEPYIVSKDTGWQIYDLIFKPASGFLNCNKPLAPNTEMTLSFDRSDSALALISKTAAAENPLKSQPLELTNVSLRARYVSSKRLRKYYQSINTREISYFYDELRLGSKNVIFIILKNKF